MIRSLLFFLCLLGGLAVAQAQYPRTMYVAIDKAPVHDSAHVEATVLGELALNDSVSVVASETTFFRIEYAGGAGYVLGSNLTLALPKSRAKNTKRSSSSTPKTEAPAAPTTSTQCTATTRAGSQCSRRVEAPQTVCWQHR